jgi:asparagine synthase (glutamine-hydrolysing)
MCGIVGRFNHRGADLSPGLMARMTLSLRHRGPDDQGMSLFRRDRTGWRCDFVPDLDQGWGLPAQGGFGHTRLSVIDLSPLGRQPMCNEDGRIWVTYNGEIYNFESMRQELARFGHAFRSRTDTEVILHAYEQWGVSCLERFNGMFAFALFDGNRNLLFLARDRLGVKPLYYHSGPGCFAFASEPKALFPCTDIPRILEPEAVQDYLTLGYTPSPNSFFRDIRKLPPGHFLLLNLENDGRKRPEPKLTSYWDTQFEPAGETGDEAEYAEELRRLLADSVRLRLVSDVPLGAFLSGGVDSSSIVSLMSRISSGPVKTFSVGFADLGYNETLFAREVSRLFGTTHEELVLPPGMYGELAEVLYFYDEPLADTSILPTYRLSLMARKRVTVCLSGDGGDELFGGYHQHWLAGQFSQATRVPAPLRLPLAWLRVHGIPRRESMRARLSPFMGLAASECIGVVGSWSEALVREIVRPSFARALGGYSSYKRLDHYYLRSRRALPLDRIQYLDLKTYLPEDILTKVDRASMAVGLEVRVPFLDYRLVEFAARLPVRYRVRAGKQKVILKHAFEQDLPRSVLERSKQGFIIPEAAWLRERAVAERIERLATPDSYVSRFILPEKIPELLRTFEKHNPYPSRLIWALLILEEWFRSMERYGGVNMPAGLG